MRIISQDGKTDVPYENVILYVGTSYDSKRGKVNKVYARSIDNVDFFPIGTYKDSEDAMDVMDQIRNCYSSGREYCYMPTEDEMLMMERNK